MLHFLGCSSDLFCTPCDSWDSLCAISALHFFQCASWNELLLGHHYIHTSSPSCMLLILIVFLSSSLVLSNSLLRLCPTHFFGENAGAFFCLILCEVIAYLCPSCLPLCSMDYSLLPWCHLLFFLYPWHHPSHSFIGYCLEAVVFCWVLGESVGTLFLVAFL